MDQIFFVAVYKNISFSLLLEAKFDLVLFPIANTAGFDVAVAKVVSLYRCK